MNNHTMNHRELLASLSDEQRVYLTAKSDAIGLGMLASHVLGLIATGSWIYFGWFGWQLLLLAHGIQIMFLFTLLHETVHETPFASRWLNTVTGLACSYVLVLPQTWFGYFHLAHHRYTHDPDKDPELQRAPTDTLSSYIWRVSGLPVWWLQIKAMFLNASGRFDYPYLPKSAYGRVKRESRIMLCFYVGLSALCIYSGNSSVLYLWVLPVILGQPFLRLYLMAEHGRCPHVANMLENSRTTYTTRLVRWLAWNMPFHAEHHAFPAVPFHKLAEFHEIAKYHVRTLENGYTSFHKETLREIDGAG